MTGHCTSCRLGHDVEAGRQTLRRFSFAVLVTLATAPLHAQVGDSTVTPRSVTVTAADDQQLSADLYGKGHKGIVIIGHGGYSTRATWAPQATALAMSGFRALVLDTRAVPAIAERREDPCIYDPVCQSVDVLAAVRWLKEAGVTSVAAIGGSMGGGAVAQAAVDAKAGEIDRIVLLAPAEIERPERMQGRTLVIVARDDANSSGPRLPGIRRQYDRISGPKRLVLLDGSAHGQRIFRTSDSARVMNEISSFLREP